MDYNRDNRKKKKCKERKVEIEGRKDEGETGLMKCYLLETDWVYMTEEEIKTGARTSNEKQDCSHMGI